MNQKQKTIETYKEKNKVKVFDEARNKYLYQKYKHKIESSFLKKAIKSLKKNKLCPFYLSTKKNGFLNLVHPENYIMKSKNLEKVKKVVPGFIRKFLIKKGY